MSSVALGILLGLPLVTALSCGLLKQRNAIEWVNGIGSFLTLCAAVWITFIVAIEGQILTPKGLFFVDALSNFIILLIAVIGFASSLYSVEYLRAPTTERPISDGQIRQYYAILHLFLFTMLLVPVSNNIGFLWIAIESTTLASAFLVGFYDDEVSVEAAWKYIILCSVGIAFALFGTILTYYSGRSILLGSGDALQWTRLMVVAEKLDPQVVKLAFIFILVGYGTKAGIVPLHSWLPDAHSQAPSPISALLSGVLLNSALYAILRFHLLVTRSIGGEFSGTLLIIFGLLSIVFAAPFMIAQRNFKRLLAYSSIEHVGIIIFGFGLGTPLGLYGASLHMLNNALAKVLLFFTTGNIIHKYHTKLIPKISGLIKVMPFTGIVFILGIFAITGWPPFGLFISEFTIASAAFSGTNIFAGILFVLFATLPFIGFIYYGSKMFFGTPRVNIPKEREHVVSLTIFVVILFTLTLLGIYIPSGLNTILHNIASAYQQ